MSSNTDIPNRQKERSNDTAKEEETPASPVYNDTPDSEEKRRQDLKDQSLKTGDVSRERRLRQEEKEEDTRLTKSEARGNSPVYKSVPDSPGTKADFDEDMIVRSGENSQSRRSGKNKEAEETPSHPNELESSDMALVNSKIAMFRTANITQRKHLKYKNKTILPLFETRRLASHQHAAGSRFIDMALELFIPSCVRSPPGHLHLPDIERPLRIRIEGPRKSIEKLLPSIVWDTRVFDGKFPQEAGPSLATLTFRHIYGESVRSDVPGDLVLTTCVFLNSDFDYYGVTFDHLVPVDDADPEVLQLNIIEVESDHGKNANEYMRFPVDALEYAGKKVLTVPRCCQKRKGTTDRARVNNEVLYRDGHPNPWMQSK
ncbi:hypothetical protein CSIM01_03205 [Colletotrichum simmondsii]|uniref:Uncharacterized protein n=1 Tax=Colletotrichum simmondsii TaxID=703756 RepID=A0A135SBT9_9PEZI|nr:hypothetical protein CSIM01_03205 [Colletotrichum simmondsii]